MEFSEYQKAIFAAVADPDGESLIVNAVAGSGKTSTIMEAVRRLPEDLRVLMVAFNKSISEELKRRAPRHVMISTYHALGFGQYRRLHGNVRVEGNKLRDLWRKMQDVDHVIDRNEAIMYGAFVMRLVGLAKQAGIGYLIANDRSVWSDIVEHHDLYLESKDATEARGISLAQDLLELSDKERSVIDFTDMLYFPLIDDLRFFQNDYVFIDEAQDTDAVQRALLKRMLKPGGKLIAVGDRHQAIYGFRGADSTAMDLIRDEFGCEELPLSISYRCPQAVVAEAQSIVPQIEASPKAQVGEVTELPSYDWKGFGPHDVILCRNTAPLIDMAYWFLRHGVAAKVLGREIGAGLVALIKKMGVTALGPLEDKLAAYCDREVAKLVSKGDDTKAEAIRDRVDCILMIIEHLPEGTRTVAGLVTVIESLFKDGNGCLTLSTVHKSKGLEWDTVYLLDRDNLMPSRWARKPWQKQQELNLIYVAVTRPKNRLIHIDRTGRKD